MPTEIATAPATKAKAGLPFPPGCPVEGGQGHTAQELAGAAFEALAVAVVMLAIVAGFLVWGMP